MCAAFSHADKPDGVGDDPADRDGEPDADLAQRGGGEQIGEQDAQAERDDGQHHRHACAIHGAIVAVEQEQKADADVACTLDTQVSDPGGDHGGGARLGRVDEDVHQRRGKDENQGGDGGTVERTHEKRLPRAAADAVTRPRAVVLRHEGGIGVAEVLRGEVGEAVDLDRGGKGRHHGRTEAVDQALHHEDAEVHHRLLQAGQRGKPGDAAQHLGRELPLGGGGEEVTAAKGGVEHDADRGDVLCDHGRGRRTGDAEGQHGDKQQIQPDIEQGGDAEKPKRGRRVAECAEQAGEKIVHRGRKNPGKDDAQVFPHAGQNLGRYAERVQDRVEPKIHRRADEQRQDGDQYAGVPDARAQARLVFFAAADGEKRTSSHRQSEKNRSEKGHQRVGRADGGERFLAEHAPDDQRVRNIIKLLQEVARHHRQGKP